MGAFGWGARKFMLNKFIVLFFPLHIYYALGPSRRGEIQQKPGKWHTQLAVCNSKSLCHSKNTIPFATKTLPTRKKYFRIIFRITVSRFRFLRIKFRKLPDTYCICVSCVTLPGWDPCPWRIIFITVTRFEFFRINWVMFSWQMVLRIVSLVRRGFFGAPILLSFSSLWGGGRGSLLFSSFFRECEEQAGALFCA